MYEAASNSALHRGPVPSVQGCSTLQRHPRLAGAQPKVRSVGLLDTKPFALSAVFCGSIFLTLQWVSDDDPAANCPPAAAAVRKVFNRK
jgi:hypothetical protein